MQAGLRDNIYINQTMLELGSMSPPYKTEYNRKSEREIVWWSGGDVVNCENISKV